VSTYGKATACVNRLTQQQKKAFSSHGGAMRWIRRREAQGWWAEGRYIPFPCKAHGFHVGGAPRHLRGDRLRHG
jgi:hypothetical protein